MARPKRSYTAVLNSLRHVWKVERIDDADCFWEAGAAAEQAFDPKSLRVATWNMYKGAGGRLFEHDFRSLCYRSDLILTQEALLSQRSMRLFLERDFQFIHAASYRRADGLRDGVMTGARVQPLNKPLRVVCKTPEPVFKTPKVALAQTYPIQGGATLLVVNLHATLVRGPKGTRAEMDHLLAQLPEHDGPMIVGGDFNTFTPAHLRVVREVLGRKGLELTEVPDDPRSPTAALDMFFTRGLVSRKTIVDTTIKNSDHFPVLAHFELAE